jgi:hypothetical protein
MLIGVNALHTIERGCAPRFVAAAALISRKNPNITPI